MLAKRSAGAAGAERFAGRLEGEIRDVQAIGTHLVYLVRLKTSSSVQKVTDLFTLNAVLSGDAGNGSCDLSSSPFTHCRRGIFIVISITYPPDE